MLNYLKAYYFSTVIALCNQNITFFALVIIYDENK